MMTLDLDSLRSSSWSSSATRFLRQRSAAGWQVYNAAKQSIGAGEIDLDSETFRMSLHGSNSNAPDLTLETLDQVTSLLPVAPGGMVTRWIVDVEPSQMIFEGDDVRWLAGDGGISDVKNAVIASASAPYRLLAVYALPVARNIIAGTAFTIVTSTIFVMT